MTRSPLTLQQLLRLVQDDRAVEDLRRYFSVDAPAGAPPMYTGGRFEALGGGGDRPESANRITAEDLVAVQMLSVKVPGPVALDLLEGDLGEQVAQQLAAIPSNVTVTDAEATELIGPTGPAVAAWRLLERPYDMGWVTAGKLMARKRPHLIPVLDRVVRCAMGFPPPDGIWFWFNERMRADGCALTGALTTAREVAEVSPRVAPLRTLDVVMWMRHRGEHRHRGCPGVAA